MPIPVVSLPIALAGCAITCSAYAVALSTERGKRWTLNHTEWSVVVGVVLVLIWAALVDWRMAGTMLAFFMAGGAPMILRSYWLRRENDRLVINYLRAELAKRTDESGE